jgi:hypothetical protein
MMHTYENADWVPALYDFMDHHDRWHVYLLVRNKWIYYNNYYYLKGSYLLHFNGVRNLCGMGGHFPPIECKGNTNFMIPCSSVTCSSNRNYMWMSIEDIHATYAWFWSSNVPSLFLFNINIHNQCNPHIISQLSKD